MAKRASVWPWVFVGGLATVAWWSWRRNRGVQVGALAGTMGTTGTEFAEAAAKLSTDQDRQRLGVQWLTGGRTPSSALNWVPVTYKALDTTGQEHEVTLLVSPDYLSAGTDDDHLVVPLGMPLAFEAGRQLGFELPTSAVVDQIYNAAVFRYSPAPLPPTSGSGMRSPAYWLQARAAIEAQGKPPAGTLVAGHKKDVVVTPKVQAQPTRLAIYGWHKGPGKPIQPVSLFHGQDYADYSHGIRAVHPVVEVDGEDMLYRDLLRDSVLSKLVSKEGPVDVDAIEHASRPAWNLV